MVHVVILMGPPWADVEDTSGSADLSSRRGSAATQELLKEICKDHDRAPRDRKRVPQAEESITENRLPIRGPVPGQISAPEHKEILVCHDGARNATRSGPSSLIEREDFSWWPG